MMDKTVLNLTAFIAAAPYFSLWGLYKARIGLARDFWTIAVAHRVEKLRYSVLGT
jgi:hypothetical protein